MIQDLEAAKAARLEVLATASADMRRLTASSRSGQSYTNGETLKLIGNLPPQLSAIDGSDTKYLAYDCEDSRQLSYKTLFGKKVVAPKDVATEETSFTVTENGETLKFVKIKRDEFGPRCTAALKTTDEVLKDGTLIPVLAGDQSVTVEVMPEAYVVRRPDSEDRHPAGYYYAVKMSNYAVFK